jgi:hypothetical protein
MTRNGVMPPPCARLFTMRQRSDHGAIVAEWRRRVREGWGTGSHWHTIDSTDALVRSLLDGSGPPVEALAELGRRCGVDGHALEDVMGWVAELVSLVPRTRRRRLDTRPAAVALASGWADGALERRQSQSAGLASVGALRLALLEHYGRAEALGTDPAAARALAVVEADTGLLPPAARAASTHALAHHVRQAFTDGEPIARTATGRVLVLAERSPALAMKVNDVVSASEASPLLAGCRRVRGWVERLAPDATHVDAHLADLAS